MAYFVWKTNILELMTKKSHRNFVSRKLNFLGKCQEKSKFFLFATTFLDCDSSTTTQMTPLEQFEIIKHMNMCNAMETLGTVLQRSSLWIKLARSDADEQSFDLAKYAYCITSSVG